MQKKTSREKRAPRLLFRRVRRRTRRVFDRLTDFRGRERIRRIRAMERRIADAERRHRGAADGNPIVFVNLTSAPGDIGLNMLASLLISWSFRLTGHSVRHVVCESGMIRCLQGTYPKRPAVPPPCDVCVRLRRILFPGALSFGLHPFAEPKEAGRLQDSTLDEMMTFQYKTIPLGEICLPSVRWILRRYHLEDSPVIRSIYSDYLRSGIHLLDHLERFFEDVVPRALVVFNGTFFPEALALSMAEARGIPAFSYEVGFRPHTIFIAKGTATKYPIVIPDSFRMGTQESQQLDSYLADRFQGRFSMGGTSFWPEMKDIPPSIRTLAESSRRVVTVFTNVIFDTSQTHANILFEDMFEWLDVTLGVAGECPETLFIVRCHPDEMRAGRESEEPVEGWLASGPHGRLSNVVCIPATEYISSYDLIQISDLCLVYNSTVSLEATILGKPVLAGGRVKEYREGSCYLPGSREEYKELLCRLLRDGVPPLNPEWRRKARRFMYRLMFHESIPLDAFVEPLTRYTYTLRRFDHRLLYPKRSPEMAEIHRRILGGCEVTEGSPV